MSLRRCWKYSWKFCRHDGPCESCEVEKLAKKVMESWKILAQAKKQYRNSQNNLERAKLAVERSQENIKFALNKIGSRAAKFYQAEKEPEVQDADTDTDRNAD